MASQMRIFVLMILEANFLFTKAKAFVNEYFK